MSDQIPETNVKKVLPRPESPPSFHKDHIKMWVQSRGTDPTAVPAHPNVAEKGLDPSMETNLSTALHIRDLFTPFCQEFVRKVDDIHETEIVDMLNGLEHTPQRENYISGAELDYQLDVMTIRDKNPIYSTAAGRFSEREPKPENIERYREEMEIAKQNGTEVVSIFEGRSVKFLRLLNIINSNTDPKKLARSGSATEHADGEFQSYLWAPTEQEDRYHPIQEIILPVGTYGEDLTAKLIQTTKILWQLSEQHMINESRKLTKDNPDFIYKHTARGTPVHSLQEATLTLAQVLCQATAEKLEPYQTGREAVQNLLSAHIPNKMAMQIPMGFIGPLTLAGKYVRGIVDTNSEIGKATTAKTPTKEKKFKTRLSAAFHRFVIPMMEAYRKTVEGLPLDTRGGQTGLGCPVAMRMPGNEETGIQGVEKTFWKVFDIVDRNYQYAHQE